MWSMCYFFYQYNNLKIFFGIISNRQKTPVVVIFVWVIFNYKNAVRSKIRLNKLNCNYWASRLSDFRTIVPLDYRTFGLLGFLTIGPLDYWAFGLLGLRTIGPTPVQVYYKRNKDMDFWSKCTNQRLPGACNRSPGFQFDI